MCAACQAHTKGDDAWSEMQNAASFLLSFPVDHTWAARVFAPSLPASEMLMWSLNRLKESSGHHALRSETPRFASPERRTGLRRDLGITITLEMANATWSHCLPRTPPSPLLPPVVPRTPFLAALWEVTQDILTDHTLHSALRRKTSSSQIQSWRGESTGPLAQLVRSSS